MFDTSEVWAKVLKSLRENGESVLFGACSDLGDIEFTSDCVIITAHNESVYAILKKHLPTLNKYAGGPYIDLKLAKKDTYKTDVIEKLKELFGDKLKVEER